MKKYSVQKFLALFLIVLITISIMPGCASNQNTGSNDKTSASAEKADNETTTPSEKTVDEINISYVKLPLNVPSIVEKKLRLFEEEFEKDGIKVNFPEITEGPKMTEALAAGSLDFCNALGGTSAILAAANGVDLKIIGIYSRAPKAFTIMTKDDGITSINDLKGKKIAGPKGTILHQLLLEALSRNQMSIEDVEYINMSIPQAVAAMNSDNVDAALVAGPAVPQAIDAGGRIITTGEGLLDATIVIAVRGDFLREHPDLVKRYMQVHNRSLQYMKENPEEVYKMAAEETEISEENVITMYDWYDFNPEITEKDIEELEKTQDFLLKNDMLKQPINISEIIVDQL
ncbi:MAG: aliphatic sulfonate ABC transporter substrate-binding protein [Thermoanaerobacteraceae bacterium]|uniref:NrtA/SsuA/CpmA family ABC transporter substrate-binding protein n=1 Tax=Tepidanaerobacter sp. GT38 TaxID=2722793 RepID=UPI0017DD655E|nr:NrtA/SsuA/CpmA family ABC transporter substrate-binding protein [Tepidanaerobacter sp. GT38]MCG1012225.1 NrtA/SsuA/CpmA family ABC transporter substrate-binding protein [Tepidanaerobacter sp. GT38]NLZ53464.1 aliphatic sulfonate ABC transporter substrate-binding protein [Thermoanaerobacteraceae bacterium]